MQFKSVNLDLSVPRVMGILNVTPDSFSDGGQFYQKEHALRQAEKMIKDGAHFIDIGGESTRPGAKPVSLQEELDRTIPAVESISSTFDTIVSIDTSKPQVMLEAVAAGAALINDVRALQEDDALQVAASTGANVCLMHMQGQPRSMQVSPHYHDVVDDVAAFLAERVAACEAAGISRTQILIDPGFGFGKTLSHNYQLLDRLEELHSLKIPLLVGMSRKSMIGNVLKRDVNDRQAGSIAAATIACIKGAQIHRVHDVKETVDALKIVSAMRTDFEYK
ncbi:dihydropteroate synthase [Aliiglaciecola sp. M165]|uniref:dihydropteroate synthase n=1 Tax=Aliiglaciecola sp. M165 TaxID=2593649 RepID=UPI0011811E1C|nr:dihydropteroate synthase [Aliiglaciecola sp. M165]TRY32395.1 dihydropteroate synthase [Aliiglaciecola sp. M165]